MSSRLCAENLSIRACLHRRHDHDLPLLEVEPGRIPVPQLTFHQQTGDGRLNILLNKSLERTGTIDRIIPAFCEVGRGRRCEHQPNSSFSQAITQLGKLDLHDLLQMPPRERVKDHCFIDSVQKLRAEVPPELPEHELDRKSTRLNSSHRTISYAVFCLKKK